MLRLHLELLPLPEVALALPATVTAKRSWTVRALRWHLEHQLTSSGLSASVLELLKADLPDALPTDSLVGDWFDSNGQTLRAIGDFQAGGISRWPLAPSTATCQIVEFGWRPDTLAEFFATPLASTRSAPVTVTHPTGDVFTFRLLLTAAADDGWDTPTAAAPSPAPAPAPGAAIAVAAAAAAAADAPTDVSVVGGPSDARPDAAALRPCQLQGQYQLSIPLVGGGPTAAQACRAHLNSHAHTYPHPYPNTLRLTSTLTMTLTLTPTPTPTLTLTLTLTLPVTEP